MIEGTAARSAIALPAAREVVAFSVVGSIAFAIHFAVVAAIVPLGAPPLAANAVGFIAAYGVSLVGHSRWTFPTPEAARARVMRRFLAIAALGFVANETLYWVLLRLTPISYRLSLLAALGIAAALTLTLSRCWAFANDD